MSESLQKLALSCVSLIAIVVLSACGGGGSNSGGTSPPIATPDTTPPVVTFNPTTLTVESELSVDVTLTATDNIGVTSGPSVTCTNGSAFSNNVFTSPTRVTPITSVCTATASDAAGNSSEATLTVMIEPRPAFSRTADTITLDPVVGMINIPTEPGTLVGITRNAANGTVSTFATNTAGFGQFDDAVVTAQSTLGTVGVAPLNVLFANTSGFQDGKSDLVFLDKTNEELIAVPLNADNTSGLPIVQSVPNACAAGNGAHTSVSRPGSNATERTDILVGTTDGLFLVEAGDSNGDGGSGLSAPIPLVTGGNFCNLFVERFVRETIYAAYNSMTGVLMAFQETSGDTNDYELIFTSDISDKFPANAEHLLMSGFQDGFGLDALYNVFKNPEGGTTLVQSLVGSREFVTTYDLDIESPTDIVVFQNGGRQRVALVSPTSGIAVYIPTPRLAQTNIEVLDIGSGFDQIDYSADAGSLIFSSSTQGNIIVRPF